MNREIEHESVGNEFPRVKSVLSAMLMNIDEIMNENVENLTGGECAITKSSV